jgi:peptidoglycan/LPS O-acetylase OafA/YrhL
MGDWGIYAMTATAVTAWSAGCYALYRSTRRKAIWSAAPTVAGCLFLLGWCVAGISLVPQAAGLVALWLGIGGIALLHLRAALEAADRQIGDRVLWNTEEPVSAGDAEVWWK